jgi:hypothetical protein
VYEFVSYFGTFLVMLFINCLQWIHLSKNLSLRKRTPQKKLIIATGIFSLSLLYRAIYNLTKVFLTEQIFTYEHRFWFLIIHTAMIVLPLLVLFIMQNMSTRAKLRGDVVNSSVDEGFNN